MKEEETTSRQLSPEEVQAAYGTDADYYMLDPSLQYPPANLADRQRLCVVVSHPARVQCGAGSRVWHRAQDCQTEVQDGLNLAVAVWLG